MSDREFHDMVLVHLPWTDLSLPPAASAVLKGIAESQGYKIKVYDSTVDLKRKFCNDDIAKFENIQDCFVSLNEDDESREIIDRYYDHIIRKLEKYSFRFVGISVFSGWTQKSTLDLCKRIRETHPEWKIVVGGRGLTTFPHISAWSRLTSAEKLIEFHSILKKKKLIDYAILGDGEDAILELFDGTYDNAPIRRNALVSKLDYPFSNFDDLDLSGYIGIMGRIQLPVISSKGCVRACDFCDVGAQFTKFQTKDGRRLAEEIIHLSNRHGVKEFTLSDSIMNGNMKSLKELLVAMAEYQGHLPKEEKIKISGNWICRPPNSIKPDFFELMARAGCDTLTVGAEHGSNAVLEAMDKKTNVEGLYFDINELHRNNMQAALNNIIGHWAEKFEDFLLHIDMFLNLGPMYANRTVAFQLLGPGYLMLKDTPADHNRINNRIVNTEDNFTFLWYTSKNPNLTLKTRIARWYIFYAMCMDYGIPVRWIYSNLVSYHTRLKETFKESQIFYKNNVDKENYIPCPSVKLTENWKEVIENRVQQLFKNTKLILELEAFSSNGSPSLFVKYNDQTIFHDTLEDGTVKLEFDLVNDYTRECVVEFGLDNKAPNDTEVDSDGNIIADKKILVKSVIIDQTDIFKDQEFFYKDLDYFDGEQRLEISRPGFFSNSSLSIKYDAPFWRFYCRNRIEQPELWVDNKEKSIEKFYEGLDEIKQFIDRYEY